MNDLRKLPAIGLPVSATAAALLDLAVCLLMAAGSAQMIFVTVLIFSEVLLIAAAVLQWVFYFRGYVDFRIDQLRQERQHAR